MPRRRRRGGGRGSRGCGGLRLGRRGRRQRRRRRARRRRARRAPRHAGAARPRAARPRARASHAYGTYALVPHATHHPQTLSFDAFSIPAEYFGTEKLTHTVFDLRIKPRIHIPPFTLPR